MRTDSTYFTPDSLAQGKTHALPEDTGYTALDGGTRNAHQIHVHMLETRAQNCKPAFGNELRRHWLPRCWTPFK